MAATNQNSLVRLKCIKEGSKLRMKIVSNGYFTEANCMFPRDIRKEGLIYEVPSTDIVLRTSKTCKYFYNVKKNNIKILGGTDAPQIPEKIYEDADSPDCIICMDRAKCIIINPCGHFYLCRECSEENDSCPICRGKIIGRINKDDMEV